MRTSLSPAPTTADVGRLPNIARSSPLTPDDFRRLADAWSACGVWASQWNTDLTCVDESGKRPRFWDLLWTSSDDFRTALQTCAREAIQSPGQIKRQSAWTPWGSSIACIAFPTKINRRVTGAVVGACVTNSDFSEELVRLCDRSGLDVAAMRQMAEAAAVLLTPGTVQLLGLTVEQSAQNDLHCDEISALAQNLETTYEELHLLYKISGGMTFTNGPVRVLELVARELKNVCRAAGIAFVLKESEATLVRGVSPAFSIPTLADRIIQVGQVAPTLEDLDRLAEHLHAEPTGSQAHLLINSADKRADLDWAGAWLKHLVVLPLWCERRLLGVMFALNCTDGGDFTSVDVQLFRAVADRVMPFLENHRLYEDLADLLMGMLHALVSSIDAKDTYTCGHSERVAYISRALARSAGLSDELCERIYLAGLLHDVGKIGVPDSILCKMGKLTAEEFEAMRRHPEIGAKILSRVRQIHDLLPGVLYHHERIDGRGYPDGLAGENIPLLGRLICIADCFDAMTTNRTYRSALPLPVALAEVRRCAGTQFDPKLAEVFLGLDHQTLLKEAMTISNTQEILCIGRDHHEGKA